MTAIGELTRTVVAVGREPVTDTLDLGNTSIETDGRGFIPTDDRARTAAERVLAVGDVAGEPLLAHKASKEGEVAADVIAGGDAALSSRAIPAAVFTDPEIATVGMTEAEAREAGHDPVSLPMAYAWNPTAVGAKTEETVLVTDDRIEVISETGDVSTRTAAAVGFDAEIPVSDVLLR